MTDTLSNLYPTVSCWMAKAVLFQCVFLCLEKHFVEKTLSKKGTWNTHIHTHTQHTRVQQTHTRTLTHFSRIYLLNEL